MMTIANGVSPLLGYVCYSCGNNGKIFVNGQIFSIFRLLPMYLIFSMWKTTILKTKAVRWNGPWTAFVPYERCGNDLTMMYRRLSLLTNFLGTMNGTSFGSSAPVRSTTRTPGL